MDNVTENEKWTLSKKLLEFQKSGLISYRMYLSEQLEFASNSQSRSAYKKYVLNQLELNNKKIEEIDAKLG